VRDLWSTKNVLKVLIGTFEENTINEGIEEKNLIPSSSELMDEFVEVLPTIAFSIPSFGV
jgi:hypothetical protein